MDIIVNGPCVGHQYSADGELTSDGYVCAISADSIFCSDDVRRAWQASYEERFKNALNKTRELAAKTYAALPDNVFAHEAAYLAGAVEQPDTNTLSAVARAIEWQRAEKSRKEAEDARALEIEKSREGVECRVIEAGDASGDPYAKVEISIDGDEPLKFTCRNIFDVGYVINPDYPVSPGMEPGGIADRGAWMDFCENNGWVKVRDLTHEERRAMRYLALNPPLKAAIRM